MCAARHGGTQKEKSDLPLCSEALQLLPAVEDDVGLFGFHIARNPPVQSCPASLRARRHFDRLLTEPKEDKQKAENSKTASHLKSTPEVAAGAPPSQTAF